MSRKQYGEVIEETEEQIQEQLPEIEEDVPNESKEDKFKRLAVKRITKALKAIQTIGNLSAKGNYTYTEEQVTKIGATLITEVQNTMAKFQPKDEKAIQFSL